MLNMNRLVTIPRDRAHWLELRKKNLNSTDIAVLFGLSPYMTYFELWHRMHKQMEDDFQDNERSVWGSRLQDAIAQGIAADEKWSVSPAIEYISLPAQRIGSSFDWWIGQDGILEIKNVDSLIFKEGWLVDEDKNIEAPPHIELQVQHQLLVSGRSFVRIAAFIGGNKVVLLERKPDQAVADVILGRSAAFWSSIDRGEEPTPDFEKDSVFIAKRLYNQAIPGKVMDASESIEFFNLASEYEKKRQTAKEAEQAKDILKAKILMLAGTCEKVLGNGFYANTNVTAPVLVEAFERKGSRQMRLYWRKTK